MNWSFIRMIFLFMVLPFSVSAITYDPLLLRAQASMFPKIILLDQQVANKTRDGRITISIVSTEEDLLVAQEFKDAIENKYNNKLGSNALVVNVIMFKEFDSNVLSTAYIVLNGSGLMYQSVVNHASKNDRIVFSYGYADFDKNSLISLLVKEKTYIYLNKSAVKLYDIKFLSAFYKIAKIIE